MRQEVPDLGGGQGPLRSEALEGEAVDLQALRGRFQDAESSS